MPYDSTPPSARARKLAIGERRQFITTTQHAGNFQNLFGVCCPVCQNNCCHLDSVKYGEGERAEIEFYCESGHRWQWVFMAHEGALQLWTARVANAAWRGDDEAEIDVLETLNSVMRYLQDAPNIMLYGLMQRVLVAEIVIRDDGIYLPFAPEHTFQVTKLREAKHIAILEEAFDAVLGAHWPVYIVTKTAAPPPPSLPMPVQQQQGQQQQRRTRENIPSAIRWFLIQKADYTCSYCGRRKHSSKVGPDGRPWHLDHADPLARGGADEPENLVLSCERCNLKKGTRHADEFRR